MTTGRITVAVAQLAYHPTLDGQVFDPIADPLFDPSRPSSSLRPTPLPPPHESRLITLEQRIRAVYLEHLGARLKAICDACRRWRVDVLVFPEAAVHRSLFPKLFEHGFTTIVSDHPTAGSDTAVYRAVPALSYIDNESPLTEPPRGRATLGMMQGGYANIRLVDDPRGMAWYTLEGRRSKAVIASITVDEWIYRTRRAAPDSFPPAPTDHLLAVLGDGSNASDIAATLSDPRWTCPVLLANPATAGGSRIFAGADASMADPQTALDPLLPGEEGVLVASIDLTTGRPVVVEFGAAASLVYAAHPTTAAYREWHEKWQQQHLQLGYGYGDLTRLQDAIVDARPVLRAVASLAGAPTRSRRLRHLDEHLYTFSRDRTLLATTREVLLPRNILPLDRLRVALGLAAERQIVAWARFDGGAWRATLDHLRARLDAEPAIEAVRQPTADLWTDHGRAALAAVEAAVFSETDPVASPPTARSERLAVGDNRTIDLFAVAELSDDEWAVGMRPFEEPALWLCLDGAVDLKLVTLSSSRSACAITGRLADEPRLWWLAGHVPADPADVAAIKDSLWRRFPGLKVHTLNLAELRARLPALQTRFAALRPALADDRSTRFAGHLAPRSARFADLQMSAPALALLDEWTTTEVPVAGLVGEAGAGKSTLLCEWTRRRWSSGTRPLPIAVTLPVDGRDPIAVILEQAALADTPADRAALQLMLRHRWFVPLLDDSDPLVAADLRPLHQLLVHSGDGQVLVTLRGDSADVLSPLVQQLERSVFPIHLDPLTPAQIDDLVARFRPDARERIARITEAPDVAEFLGVPLLLGMMLEVIEHLDPILEVTRADLLDLCTDPWLRRADPDAVEFVEDLALTLWQENAAHRRLDRLRAPVLDNAPFLARNAASVRFVHTSFADLFLARALLRRLPQQPGALLAKPPPPVFGLIAHQIRRQARESIDHPLLGALTEWLRTAPTDPALDRETQRRCSSHAALYLHGIGSFLDSARQWIPSGVNLTHASLADHDLRGIQLAGVHLDAAALPHADLRDAVLRGASLIGAYLNGARLDHADLRSANLRMARLHDAEADGCDLRDADLSNAYLDRSMWTECRWTGARIEPNDPSPWLNLRGTGTALGNNLPEAWRLTSTSRSPPALSHLEYSADGRLLAVALAGRITLVDLVTGTFRLLSGRSALFRWAPEGHKFAYRDREGGMYIGDLADGLAPTGPLPVVALMRWALAFDWQPGDSRPLLMTRRGIEAHAADGNGWRVLAPLPPLRDRHHSFFYLPRLLRSARGAIALNQTDGSLHFYPSTAAPPIRIEPDTAMLSQVCFSSTGDFLALRGASATTLVDLRDPGDPRTFSLTDEAEQLAWLPGGNVLTYTRKGNFLTHYDAERRVAITDRRLSVHVDRLRLSHDIDAITWRPDRARLAIASSKCCVRIERPDGAMDVELFFHEDDYAITVPGGCFTLGDPESRRFSVQAAFDQDSATFPLGGLRRVLHRPDVVEAVLRGEPPPTTAAQILADLGWSDPPGSFGEEHAGVVLVENPFHASQPLAGPDLPGRAHVLRQLEELLTRCAPVLIKGPRRGGKTSVLRALAARQKPRREVHRLSLAGKRLHTPDDLALRIDPSLGGDPRPADALLQRLVAGRASPPALLLDEIDWLRDGDESLFAWLRMLGQEGLVALALAGSHGDWVEVVKAANRMPGSSFGNDFITIELTPLTDDDAIRFLVDTSPPDVPIHPTRTAAWILECCGTWPYYLQAMGYVVVEAVRGGHRRPLVDRHALRELYEGKLLVDGFAVFRSRWADLRRPAQEQLLIELDRARTARRLELTPYRDLSRTARAALSNAGLIDAMRGWTIDRPFRDWLHRNLDELEPSDA